jgi:mannose-6-phosphate isomerase-like protein (cupin superfamily)
MRAQRNDDPGLRPFRFERRTPNPVMRAEGVPDAAVALLTSDRLYTVMIHESNAGPWGQSAIPGPPGVALILAECEPGRGPDLHAHRATDEIFTCLRGRFEVRWGDGGEHAVELAPFDAIRVPPGVQRAFRNISSEPGMLQVLITGGDNDANDISFPAAVEAKLRAIGAGVPDALRRQGFGFDSDHEGR